MPDIATTQATPLQGRLNWVGMAGLDIPLKWEVGGEAMTLPAKGKAYVNLIDEKAKGIHMSRLYLAVDKRLKEEALTPAILEALLREFIQSHEKLSDASLLQVNFEMPLRRKALKSDNWGWRQYPVEIRGEWIRGELRITVGVEVLYSSTCPCSAALARQLIQMQFEKDFDDASVSKEEVLKWLGSEKGIVATPHSQRSVAKVKVRLAPQAQSFKVLEIIDAIEAQLKTPVQAAVKREDEQEFSQLNGQNLMFCEDASRRLVSGLNQLSFVSDYSIECSHLESLHPHDAVSIVTKGIPGGFQ